MYPEVDDVPGLVTVKEREGGLLTGTGEQAIFSKLQLMARQTYGDIESQCKLL